MTAKRKCPMCERPVQERYKPFCSKRCADADLLRWLKGAYAIPAAEALGENDDAPPAAPEADPGAKN